MSSDDLSNTDSTTNHNQSHKWTKDKVLTDFTSELREKFDHFLDNKYETQGLFYTNEQRHCLLTLKSLMETPHRYRPLVKQHFDKSLAQDKQLDRSVKISNNEWIFPAYSST